MTAPDYAWTVTPKSLVPQGFSRVFGRAYSFTAKNIHTPTMEYFSEVRRMGTIEKRGKNSWRVGVQVQTERGWEWVRRTIKMPQGMS